MSIEKTKLIGICGYEPNHRFSPHFLHTIINAPYHLVDEDNYVEVSSAKMRNNYGFRHYRDPADELIRDGYLEIKMVGDMELFSYHDKEQGNGICKKFRLTEKAKKAGIEVRKITEKKTCQLFKQKRRDDKKSLTKRMSRAFDKRLRDMPLKFATGTDIYITEEEKLLSSKKQRDILHYRNIQKEYIKDEEYHRCKQGKTDRLYHKYNNTEKGYRSQLTWNGQFLADVDTANSQMQILALKMMDMEMCDDSIREFAKICFAGEWYEWIIEKVYVHFKGKIITRDEAKLKTLKHFFGPAKRKTMMKKLMQAYFRPLEKYMVEQKRIHGYSYFAGVLQKEEARIFHGHVGRILLETVPDKYWTSVHDSYLCEQDIAEYTKSLIENAMMGRVPTMNIKPAVRITYYEKKDLGEILVFDKNTEEWRPMGEGALLR